MTNKKEICLLGLVIVFGFIACETEGHDMSDLPGLSPAACDQYCEDYYNCEYSLDDFEGEYGEEHFEKMVEGCKVGCGWYLSEGAYVVHYDGSVDPSVYEYVEFIPGGRIAAYFKCLVNTELHQCEDVDDWGYYYLHPSDGSECEMVAECWDKLESNDLGEVVWQEIDSQEGCWLVQDVGEMEEFYLSFPYDGSLELYEDYY